MGCVAFAGRPPSRTGSSLATPRSPPPPSSPAIEPPRLRSPCWLAGGGDDRQPEWQLDPVEERERRHQLIEHGRAAQLPLSEQADIDQPSEGAHRVASPDPLDDKAARLELAP